jgi:rhamnose utilization protein RhaD (predicted bifunctional aldolase and dehydrogenase)
MSADKDLDILVRLSKFFGANPVLVQGAGGNNSVKSEDGNMMVKASGLALKNLSKDFGWVAVPFQDIKALVGKGPDTSKLDPAIDDWLAVEVDKLTRSPVMGAKASIEAGMHAVLSKIVVHIHPVELNVLLCADGGRALCQDIFKGIDYLWVDPLPPGYYLSRAIFDGMQTHNSAKPAVIFMASHGVIFHADTEDQIHLLYDQVIGRTRDWLRSRGLTVNQLVIDKWESEISARDIFPDTVVFQALAKNLDQVAPEKKQGIIETFAASKAIRDGQAKVGLKSADLARAVCDYILGMSREKHRQAAAMKVKG